MAIVGINPGTIQTVDVADGAITTVKLDSSTAGSEAVSTAKIRDNAITTAKLDSSTAGSEAVTTAKIRDSAVTTIKLDGTAGSEAVTSAKIRDAAATAAKMDGSLLRAMMQGRQNFVETAEDGTGQSNAATPEALTTVDSISFTPSVGAVNYEITVIYEADYANPVTVTAAQAHLQLDGTDIGHVSFPTPSAINTFARTLGTVVSTGLHPVQLD